MQGNWIDCPECKEDVERGQLRCANCGWRSPIAKVVELERKRRGGPKGSKRTFRLPGAQSKRYGSKFQADRPTLATNRVWDAVEKEKIRSRI
jgi:hypothetical protein